MAEYTFQETNIYKKAFKQAMEIFETSNFFPKEETYSLTDQVRRSSRSVYVQTMLKHIENVDILHTLSPS